MKLSRTFFILGVLLIDNKILEINIGISFISQPIAQRDKSVFIASSVVTPEPRNGSKITSPLFDNESINLSQTLKAFWDQYICELYIGLFFVGVKLHKSYLRESILT